MRINPHLPRLRLVALGCWVLGAWCFAAATPQLLGVAANGLLLVAVQVLGAISLAVGIAFWLLAGDRRAGIVFEPKGLVLHLGHAAAFVAWENIERIGVTESRLSLLALGSSRQFGIALKDVEPYLQSYEERLPAARGPLARLLRWLQGALRLPATSRDDTLSARVAACRRATGFHILLPETLIGGSAPAFAELVDGYRRSPLRRRELAPSA